MPENNHPQVCQVCRCEKPAAEIVPAQVIRPSLVEMIKRRFPQWDANGFICHDDLGNFRRDYVANALEEELGELSSLEKEVADSLRERELLSENINAEFAKQLTFGEELSDKIASFGGSWTFIIIFGAVLFGWLALNSLVLANKAFDPYPYILMNLILSCLAAIQAPIIMMSQNRSEARDRMRAENDYKINLKAELEIRHLHEKMDHLLRRQYQRLFETQQIQIELLESLSQRQKMNAD